MYSAEIRLCGTVGSALMMPWISRHAAKLSVRIEVLERSAELLILRVQGAEEMVQALALGCSLGPADADVHDVQVSPLGVD